MERDHRAQFDDAIARHWHPHHKDLDFASISIATTRANGFLGLKYFTLDNMWTDVAMIEERVTMLLFGRLGLPVPREAHVRLFINDEYVGLYVAVEALDDVFIERRLGSSTGYLYEFNWLSDYRFQYLGPICPTTRCLNQRRGPRIRTP